MNDKEIKELIRNSHWTNNEPKISIKKADGKIYEIGITENTLKNYISYISKWKEIFEGIIKEIKDYVSNDKYSDSKYKEKIRCEISKLEEIKFESLQNNEDANIQNGAQRISSPKYLNIKSGTLLYRYTDDYTNHMYANPNPQTYGRFTDPESKLRPFYLAFDKKVARDEVAGTKSKELVKFEASTDIKALIVPGGLLQINKEDEFFESRLKRFHNLVFSLKTSDSYFCTLYKNKQDKEKLETRMKKGIYIVTNELFNFILLPNVNAIVYPSTKVSENSYLGREENNQYFIPNKKNANLAILNDVNFDKNGIAFSKYVKPI